MPCLSSPTPSLKGRQTVMEHRRWLPSSSHRCTKEKQDEGNLANAVANHFKEGVATVNQSTHNTKSTTFSHLWNNSNRLFAGLLRWFPDERTRFGGIPNQWKVQLAQFFFFFFFVSTLIARFPQNQFHFEICPLGEYHAFVTSFVNVLSHRT